MSGGKPSALIGPGVLVVLLNVLVRAGASAFALFMREFAATGRNCGPRVGVPCPSGAGYGLAGRWAAGFAVLVLLAHLRRGGVRGPMPAAVVSLVPGVLIGVRRPWAAVFVADTAQTRVVMTVIGLPAVGLLGVLYGRWLFRRRGTALPLWCVRPDRDGPVMPSGSAETGPRDVLLAMSPAGTVIGCCAGAALVAG